jgi:tetratricopeptide (TPR) repeat protein
MALLEELAPGKARKCHAKVLDCLLANQPERSLGRIVHHAAAAGRAELVTRYGVDAAREAAAVGAHREAAAHYGRTLEYGVLLPDDERAVLCEARAYELYLIGQIPDAQRMRERALELHVRLGDSLRIGDNIRWLSRIAWARGDQPQALALAERAIERLEQVSPGRELAFALSNRSQLAMLADRMAEAVEFGTRALDLARRLGDLEIEAHALNNIGSARGLSGDSSGLQDLERSLDIAVRHNLVEHAARAWTNIASIRIVARDHAGTEQLLERGITYTERLDLPFEGHCLYALRAQLWLDRGEWSRAAAAPSALRELTHQAVVSGIPAVVVAARV